MQFRLYFGRLRAAQWNRMGAAEIMGRRPEEVGPWPIGAQEGIGRWPVPMGGADGGRWSSGRVGSGRRERGPMATAEEEAEATCGARPMDRGLTGLRGRAGRGVHVDSTRTERGEEQGAIGRPRRAGAPANLRRIGGGGHAAGRDDVESVRGAD